MVYVLIVNRVETLFRLSMLENSYKPKVWKYEILFKNKPSEYQLYISFNIFWFLYIQFYFHSKKF